MKENTNEYYQNWNKQVCDIQAKQGGDIGAVRNILNCEMEYRVKFQMLLREVSALEQEYKNSFNESQKLSVDVIKGNVNNAINLLDQKIESGKSTIDFMIKTEQ